MDGDLRPGSPYRRSAGVPAVSIPRMIAVVDVGRANPPVRTSPIRPGLTFHELRHSHKTWLITAGIPEIAQARRLGHRLDRRIVEVYSHVADEIEARIQAVLKQA